MEAWKQPENFALWFGIALSVVILLAASVIIINRLFMKRLLYEEQKAAAAKIAYQEQLLKDSIRVQERERERIAANLHDDLISKLNIVNLLLYSGQAYEQADPHKLLEESIHLARGISHDLMPPLLADHSLEELFNDFLIPLRQQYKVHFTHRGETAKELEDDIKLQILRVFQEVINNCLKHAEASQLSVCLRYSPGGLALVIQDDGKGFDTKGKTKGLGQKNIELRIQSLKGAYKFNSKPGVGTRFIAYLPV